MRILSLLHNISIFLLIWLNSWLHFLPFLRGAEAEAEAEAEVEAEAMHLFLLQCLYVKLFF
jgi:hypothetical protein